MAEAIKERGDLSEQYEAFLARVRELGGAELWQEADDLYNDLRAEAREECLHHLVIGFYDGGNFPAVTGAVRIVTAEPVEIDECNHRATIAMGDTLAGMGGGEPLTAAYEAIARASLEDDLGNGDEADRLRDDARASMRQEPTMADRVGQLEDAVVELTALAHQILSRREGAIDRRDQ